MNRAQILVELQNSGLGNNTADLISQKNYVDAAYQWVWNARDPQGVPIRWSFAQVDQANLAVTAGVQPTMPADFDDADWIVDANGQKLVELDPERFDEWFAPTVAAGQTGQPSAYKVVNRQVVFGPTPSVSSTMKISYRRRLSHLNGSGNVAAGPMAADTDQPLWPDHHLILVHQAALIAHSVRSNPFSSIFQALRDDALSAMRNDLEAEFAPAQTWGDGRWRTVGW